MKKHSTSIRALAFGAAIATLGGCDVEPEDGRDLDADEAFDTDGDENRIVGGQVVNTNKYPFMTAFFADTPSRNTFFCGGTLIRKRWVLTAAHCVDWANEQQLANFRIGVGRRDIRDYTNGNTRRANRVYVHPNYNPNTLNNDVALVRLDAQVDRVLPALMTTQQEPNWAAADDIVTTIGFGNTAEDGNLSNRLREVSIPVVARGECRDAYADVYGPNAVTGKMMCAGIDQGGKDACQGDSGSALLTRQNGRWRVAGVTSWGLGCARPEFPGVYARVSSLKGWLDGCMAAPNSCGERVL